MELITSIFGVGEHLTELQMGARAVVVFIITLFLIRVAGRRTFGKKSSFDNTIAIMLGAILSRAVTGASAFWATVTAALVLALIHRFVAWLCLRNNRFSRVVKGSALSLYKDREFNRENMQYCVISEDDLMEGVRMQLSERSLDSVEEIIMETSGQLSVIKRA